MPRKVLKRLWRGKGGVKRNQHQDLLLGRRGAFRSERERRAAWAANRERLLESVNPCTRPAAWWDYEAPGGMKRDPHRSQDEQLYVLKALSREEISLLLIGPVPEGLDHRHHPGPKSLLLLGGRRQELSRRLRRGPGQLSQQLTVVEEVHPQHLRGREDPLGVPTSSTTSSTKNAASSAETLLGSVRRTGRLVIVHEANRFCGYGAELAALAAEEAFDWLKVPVRRVAPPAIPVPVSPPLEQFFKPSARDVAAAIVTTMSAGR